MSYSGINVSPLGEIVGRFAGLFAGQSEADRVLEAEERLVAKRLGGEIDGYFAELEPTSEMQRKLLLPYDWFALLTGCPTNTDHP